MNRTSQYLATTLCILFSISISLAQGLISPDEHDEAVGSNQPGADDAETQTGTEFNKLKVFDIAEWLTLGFGYYGDFDGVGGFGSEIDLAYRKDKLGRNLTSIFEVDINGLYLADPSINERGCEGELNYVIDAIGRSGNATTGNLTVFPIHFVLGLDGEADQQFDNYQAGGELGLRLEGMSLADWEFLLPVVNVGVIGGLSKVNGITGELDALLKAEAKWEIFGQDLHLWDRLMLSGGVRYWNAFGGRGVTGAGDGIGGFARLDIDVWGQLAEDPNARRYGSVFVEAEFGSVSAIRNDETTIWVGYQINGSDVWSSK